MISANMQQQLQSLGRIGVLMGGHSAERAISLQSGEAALNALKNLGANVVSIDTQTQPAKAILQANIDYAFIALHGVGGEDGKIQGLLETLSIPYSGSSVLASSLCMDKLRTKQLWRGIDLPTANFAVLSAEANFSSVLDELGGEVMVKPAHEGSSIGMSRVADGEALKQAYKQAAEYDSSVIAEQFISGAEYTVAILGEKALPAIRLQSKHAFYDFDAKYLADDTEYLCPCGLNEEKEHELQSLALSAFRSVGAFGWGRVDLMADQSGNFFLLEVNTIPGLTSHSLVPMAAKAAGISFNELIGMIALGTQLSL